MRGVTKWRATLPFQIRCYDIYMICLYEFKAQYSGEEYVTQWEAAKDHHFDGLKQAIKEAHEHLIEQIKTKHSSVIDIAIIVFSEPVLISTR